MMLAALPALSCETLALARLRADIEQIHAAQVSKPENPVLLGGGPEVWQLPGLSKDDLFRDLGPPDFWSVVRDDPSPNKTDPPGSRPPGQAQV